jgi:hypothetical protein
MPEQISLKLCLLTSITEKSEEKVENKVLISNPKNNDIACQIRSGDEQNPVSGGTPTAADSKEV